MNPRDFEPTRRATPSSSATPPTGPGPVVGQQELFLVIVLGGVAIASLTVLVPDAWPAYYAPRLWLPMWCLAALVHGGARLEGRPPWVTRVTRVVRNQLFGWGGGAYAAIAVCCFGWLEIDQLRGTIDWLTGIDWDAGRDAFREMGQGFAHNVAQLVMGSVMNTVHAVAWPGFWRKVFSAGQQWPAVGVAWGVFESAHWAVGQITRPPSSMNP